MRPGAAPIDKSGKKSFSDVSFNINNNNLHKWNNLSTKLYLQVSAAIAKTMEKMNADSDNLQNSFSDDELTKLFGGLNIDNPQVSDTII